jgi:hypothetical protein
MKGKHTNIKKLQWQFECLGHSLIESLACLLPGPLVFHIGEFIAGIIWFFMPNRRKTVIRNLRIACAEEKSLNPPTRQSQLSSHWRKSHLSYPHRPAFSGKNQKCHSYRKPRVTRSGSR